MIRRSQTKRLKMAASTSELKTQACLDKNYFDQKKDHDVNNFPVNFSGVPHIGQKIFEFLDFKDLENCRTVCKGWHNFLEEKISLWIELLEKEKIKLERSEIHGSSDWSDDLFPSLEDWEAWGDHYIGHDPDNTTVPKFNVGYVTIYYFLTKHS